MIQGMNHFTVLTDDLDKTLGFYVDLLGLKPGPRPDLGFPGAWLYVNGSAVLHIIAGRSAAGAAFRGARSHGVFGERPGGCQGETGREEDQLRAATSARRGHLAAILLRPQWGQGGARFRSVGIGLIDDGNRVSLVFGFGPLRR